MQLHLNVTENVVAVPSDYNSWLAGYPDECWLMTPIVDAAAGTPEFAYTEAQMSTRNCVERCIAVLKGRFRCIMGE
ncbi:hypothetical protein JTB14_004194 [Gonioctena quinquepunctata]|nr:hypothetical protein JTB14_004194 [Gonioctena quinquepunctata]